MFCDGGEIRVKNGHDLNGEGIEPLFFSIGKAEEREDPPKFRGKCRLDKLSSSDGRGRDKKWTNKNTEVPAVPEDTGRREAKEKGGPTKNS